MGVRVTKRHNADGSITKRTTISRKTLLGTTKSETFVERIPANKKKGGCYVATCVYGSYDCPQVWTLRRFRDNTLANSWYGRVFIRIYYATSPVLVKWFGDTKWFKRLWKPNLDRLVSLLQNKGVASTPYDD